MIGLCHQLQVEIESGDNSINFKAESIIFNGDGILHIPVEHQDEVKREIEEDRKSDRFLNADGP